MIAAERTVWANNIATLLRDEKWSLPDAVTEITVTRHMLPNILVPRPRSIPAPPVREPGARLLNRRHALPKTRAGTPRARLNLMPRPPGKKPVSELSRAVPLIHYLPTKPVARSIRLTSTLKPHIHYPRLAFSRLRVACPRWLTLPHPTRPCLLPAPRPALHLSPAPLPRVLRPRGLHPSSGSISHLFPLAFRWAEDLAFHPTRVMPLLVSWTRLRLSGPTLRLRPPTRLRPNTDFSWTSRAHPPPFPLRLLLLVLIGWLPSASTTRSCKTPSEGSVPVVLLQSPALLRRVPAS